jgi:hypothetical protein
VIPATTVRRLVTIEATDLDTDERVRSHIEVDAPIDEWAQREQLARLVAASHPDAGMRSFGKLAASFLDRRHLVVAHYGPALPTAVDAREDDVPAQDQQPLFAA